MLSFSHDLQRRGLLICDARAQAIEIATQCPAAHWATVEVRELGPCFA